MSPPLSPDLAARREGRSIDVDSVLEYCISALAHRREILLIEGVDGVMTPLDEHRIILDVMMALKLPLMLVTGSHRDAISHTLTALGSLVRRDMKVLATIVNETPRSPIALDEAIASIARFTDPVITYSARGTTEGNKKLVHLLSNAGAERSGQSRRAARRAN